MLDVELAKHLGMKVTRTIRTLIKDNASELADHGTLMASATKSTGGRPAKVFYLNESQALLVCMFSRTQKAALVRKQVIDVFMAHRQGQLIQPEPTTATEVTALFAQQMADIHLLML
ncbi:hypothetical protein TAL182_CH00123 [Rhizobium sp. TAL182]|uniref:hypothetical protein n=1 Tax=Rhizobium sp. TAL182 TaxID=2020313 RepID=UPI000A20FCA3|nr:hypothetical protein [Rhizobium sp. TAL182]ARO21958.1 hypothetical protein TAL182_CH00123 [Rhizobium sp. TAL182]